MATAAYQNAAEAQRAMADVVNNPTTIEQFAHNTKNQMEQAMKNAQGQAGMQDVQIPLPHGMPSSNELTQDWAESMGNLFGGVAGF